jgi:putative protease
MERREIVMAEEVKIGRVGHYFGKIQVAGIELTEGDLSVGDTVHIKGHTSDFTQTVDSIQIDGVEAEKAETGKLIGVRVSEHARVGDEVFRVSS